MNQEVESTPREKVVVVLSGGMDSAVLLSHLAAQGHPLKAVSFNYGQRHVRELDSAARLATAAGVEHTIADLRGLTPLFGANSLSDLSVPVPEGHYAEESMKLTIVPNRNMIMLASAIAWAISSQFDAVAYGAHSGDHAIYPDCRPEFADAMSAASLLCDWKPIRLMRPFVQFDKGQIVALGHDLKTPFELTWTCYQGGEKHCGKCGSCTERQEAFAQAGVVDPVAYV
ncbi:7-cyano-7-deazaguanine synthase QueC [Lignipirellula cremea]|uniref:7-cyano-7-deazaguanine synthase n=1 Tax=Lignipirellula cremea TaxID=2528010 RepID=A0A518DNX0_9BACT|nr:7-cyano-7-deazaguanine synthase QueC [Lignipirellula cremea]QDU93537.1 7-cyano-7-deazaguanine synthase [Lignipirellula cremea]